VAAWLLLTGLLTAGERGPNIVIILADDLGYGDLGCQGCEDVPTPHIDSIARDGVRLSFPALTADEDHNLSMTKP
jgi:arylsulfatase B